MEKRKRVKNLLFVCYGNICRSPMAERLGRKMFGEKMHIESAGVSPTASGPTEEAIQTMRSLFGLDISDHRPRHIQDVSVEKFDTVVAMDGYVYKQVLATNRIPERKIIQWNIEDPISLGLEGYKKIARKIQKNLQEFKTSFL